MKKVLVIGNRIPLPARDGGAMATLQILELYTKAGFQTDFISLNTSKHFVSDSEIEKSLSFLHSVETVFQDTAIHPLDLLKNLFFSKSSYNLQRFYSSGLEKKIIEKVANQKYDWIHIEGLYSSTVIPAIKKVSSERIFIRTHNIEHQIWERLSKENSNFLRRFYLKTMSKRLKKEEMELMSSANKLLHISPTDLTFFKKELPLIEHTYLPFAVNSNYENSQAEIIPNSIAFIGSMEWIPNIKGLEWFLNKVWPLVYKEVPSAKFRVAGKKMGDFFKNKTYLNVETHGEVPDAKEFMLQHSLLVVPLFSGSGVRIKTLEAMSLQVPVVSTSIGAQGLNVINAHQIMLADTSQGFANAIVLLLQNDSLRKQIATEGKEFVNKEHSENQVIELLKTL